MNKKNKCDEICQSFLGISSISRSVEPCMQGLECQILMYHYDYFDVGRWMGLDALIWFDQQTVVARFQFEKLRGTKLWKLMGVSLERRKLKSWSHHDFPWSFCLSLAMLKLFQKLSIRQSLPKSESWLNLSFNCGAWQLFIIRRGNNSLSFDFNLWRRWSRLRTMNIWF